MMPLTSRLLVLLFSLWIAPVSCEKTGSFHHPDGCEKSSCEIFATWVHSGDGDADDKTVTFHLAAKTDGWAAIGISADKFMGTDGIDDVLACQRDDKNDVVYAKDMYNPQDQSSFRSNQINDNQYAIETISTSYSNGSIQCSFTRLIITNNTKQDRHLNIPYYIFLAHGSETGSSDSPLQIHDRKYISSEKLNVAVGGSAVEACGVDILTRLHAICMFLTYVVLVPVGIFIAAYMKVAMKTKAMWFQIHRVVMLLSAGTAIAGFAFILAAHRETYGLIALGSGNKLGTAHFALGIAALSFHLANPVVALFRCKPKSKYRPIFNLIHVLCVGYVAKILGGINVTLGMFLFVGLSGQPLYLLPIWGLLYIGFFLIIDIGAAVYFKVIEPRLAKKKTDDFTPLVNKSTGKDKHLSDTQVSPRPVAVWVVLIGILFALGVLGGILFVLLGVGCV